jgi:hypothetical protein
MRVSWPELCRLEDVVKYDYSIGVAKESPYKAGNDTEAFNLT